MSDHADKPKKSALEVIAGPARSGKTSRVIDIFEGARARGAKPLLLVPGGPDVAALRSALCRRMPVVDTSAIVTFVALAEEVLSAAGVSFSAVTAERRELIIRAITAGLQSEGRLAFFADALDAPGLYGQILSLIGELKVWQVEPAAFRRFPTAGNPRDRDLALIYQRYQEFLRERGLYDAEGRFWEARRILEEGCPLDPVPDVLLLDGFADFTPNEMTLLEAMGRHVAEMVMTLPAAPGDSGDAFEKARDTLERLKRTFKVTETLLGGPREGGTTAVIADRLFAGSGEKSDAHGGLRAFSTAGVRMEIRETARECKRLILAGVRPSEIAVIVRRPADYLAAAHDAFTEMGVPLDVAGRMRVRRSGLFALLFALAEVVESDFERRDVVNLFSSSYVDLEGFAGMTGEGFAHAARAAGVIRGLDQWRKRLKAAAARGEDGAGEAAAALEAVERLSRLLEPLGRPIKYAEAAAALCAAIEALGVRRAILPRGVPEEALFADLAAFAALDEALSEAALCDEPAALSVRDFMVLLVTRIEDAGLGDGSAREGGVHLLDVASARNLSFRVVFLGGLTADAFPSRLPVGPFYSRAERDRLRSHGLGARDEKMHAAAERLLFYQAATRAREILYLSWPATDEKGRPILRSFYVEELLDLFDLDEDFQRRLGPARAVAGMEEAASAAEAATAAGEILGRAASVEEAAPACGLASEVSPAFPLALRCAAVETKREGLEDFGRFDAVLSAEAARCVSDEFPPGRPWSQYLLNSYAQCPFAFFLKHVLGAERPEEPEAALKPLEVGVLAHDLMSLVFTRLRAGPGIDALLRGEGAEAIESVFAESLAEVTRRHAEKRGLSGDPLWEIEARRFAAMMREFWTAQKARLGAADKNGLWHVPAYFELNFGEHGDYGAPEGADRGRAGPVTVEWEGACEQLHGRIDRLDYITDDPNAPAGGDRGLAVVDYKTSKSAVPSSTAVKRCDDLQMPLYVYALRQVAPGGVVGWPMRAIYLILRDGAEKMVLDLKNEEEFMQLSDGFRKKVVETAAEIRKGRFPAAPFGKCPSYCEGRGVCRYSEVRVEQVWEDGHDDA